MELILEMKKENGHTKFYPACEISKKLADWHEKKTFSLEDIPILKDLGFQVNVIEPLSKK